MLKSLLALFLSLLPCLSHSASKPLFSPLELSKLEHLKTDQRVFFDQILELKEQDRHYFKQVLANTSKEDLAVLRKFLPNVLDVMEKGEEAAWMKNALEKLIKK